MERRAVSVEVAIDGAQRRMKELRRRERQLIALRRRSLLPWAASIQPLARAPRAAQLLIEIIGNPGTHCAGPGLIGGDQALAVRLHKQLLGVVVEQVSPIGPTRDV